MNKNRNQRIFLFIFVGMMAMSLVGFGNFSRLGPSAPPDETTADAAVTPTPEGEPEQARDPRDVGGLGNMFRDPTRVQAEPEATLSPDDELPPEARAMLAPSPSPTPIPSPTPSRPPVSAKPLIFLNP